MSDVVRATTTNGVAVITFDHPPVNGLSFGVRTGLALPWCTTRDLGQ